VKTVEDVTNVSLMVVC